MKKERIFISERIPEPLSEGHVLDIYNRPDAKEFVEWYVAGYLKGWIGAPHCYTHDGLPVSNEEKEDDSRCVHVFRIYEDEATKRGVERDHLPSEWSSNHLNIFYS